MMHSVPRTAFVLLAIPVGVGAEMAGWRDIEPDGLNAVVLVAVLVGLVAPGVLAGWRGAVAFVPVYVVAAMIEQSAVYVQPTDGCDPFCSSPMHGLIFGIPFELALIGLGILGRRGVMSHTSRRASRATCPEV
jgi:hypothetical protein